MALQSPVEGKNTLMMYMMLCIILDFCFANLFLSCIQTAFVGAAGDWSLSLHLLSAAREAGRDGEEEVPCRRKQPQLMQETCPRCESPSWSLRVTGCEEEWRKQQEPQGADETWREIFLHGDRKQGMV